MFALGLSIRFGLHVHPQSKGLYIIEYLFVVLSVRLHMVHFARAIFTHCTRQPCAFIAADYVLLGRISKHLGADEYLLVPSRRITIVFVASDITTFLIQVRGLWHGSVWGRALITDCRP